MLSQLSQNVPGTILLKRFERSIAAEGSVEIEEPYVAMLHRLPDDQKFHRFCEVLQVDEVVGAGHYYWFQRSAQQHRRNADLTGWGPSEFDHSAHWRGEPGRFFLALQLSGIIDVTPESVRVHNAERFWQSLILAAKREYERLRKAAQRLKKKSKDTSKVKTSATKKSNRQKSVPGTFWDNWDTQNASGVHVPIHTKVHVHGDAGADGPRASAPDAVGTVSRGQNEDMLRLEDVVLLLQGAPRKWRPPSEDVELPALRALFMKLPGESISKRRFTNALLRVGRRDISKNPKFPKPAAWTYLVGIIERHGSELDFPPQKQTRKQLKKEVSPGQLEQKPAVDASTEPEQVAAPLATPEQAAAFLAPYKDRYCREEGGGSIEAQAMC